DADNENNSGVLNSDRQRSPEILQEGIVKKRRISDGKIVVTKAVVKQDEETEPKSKYKQLSRKDIIEERLDDVEFYYEKGLRKVKPYYYEYQTFAKGRWLGKSIFDVFCGEFRDRGKEYYAYAIEKGLITLNGKIVTKLTIVKNQDLITHKIHRHEPPITADAIKVLHRETDYVIVDKPASIPVHPSGRYRHNTVIHILQKEHGFPALFPMNRLDRLTSGIMILALNKEKAREFEKLMQNREIRKEYVCRVLGEFPIGEVKCDQPIKTVSHKLALNLVHPDGKPLTGRTHQIRVHLQYLGYPIANDPLYAHPRIWGPERGKGGTDTNVAEYIIEKFNKEFVCEENLVVFDEGMFLANKEKSVDGKRIDANPTDRSNNDLLKDSNSLNGGICEECTISYHPDPKPNQLLIWLHAFKYECDLWSYESELPTWANEDFDGDLEFNKDP
ncbi:14406_t:CDS:2, partial [Acaulospora morrowiae]